MKLADIQRKFGILMATGRLPEPRIPLFAVGYRGWKQLETIRERINDAPIDGILVIDPGLFLSRGVTVDGPWSLWALIACLHESVSTLKAIGASPLAYAMDTA
jgi:hypothetical protein